MLHNHRWCHLAPTDTRLRPDPKSNGRWAIMTKLVMRNSELKKAEKQHAEKRGNNLEYHNGSSGDTHPIKS
nr:CNT_HP1_G0007140.mRNA.1.CDS.1 [Saccharomyces cerevisiae]